MGTIHPGLLLEGQTLAFQGCSLEPRQTKACPTKNLPDVPFIDPSGKFFLRYGWDAHRSLISRRASVGLPTVRSEGTTGERGGRFPRELCVGDDQGTIRDEAAPFGGLADPAEEEWGDRLAGNALGVGFC